MVDVKAVWRAAWTVAAMVYEMVAETESLWASGMVAGSAVYSDASSVVSMVSVEAVLMVAKLGIAEAEEMVGALAREMVEMLAAWRVYWQGPL